MGTDNLGIDDGWWDIEGHWHHADPHTIGLIRSTLNRHGDGDTPHQGPPLWFVDAGCGEVIGCPATLRLEDGGEVEAVHNLPSDLPIGVHELVPADGGPVTTLFIAPATLPGLGGRRWGVVAQLYAARSHRSWGIGDLSDLRMLGRWVAAHGGSVLGVNPLGEALDVVPREPSPYSPSTRRHVDPLWIDVSDLTGHAGTPPTNGRHIHRDAVWQAKRAALLAGYEAAGAPLGDGDLRHAVFCAVTEEFGCGWLGWPAELRRPDGEAVEKFTADHAEQVGFWRWVEQLADYQLFDVREELRHAGVTLLGDLTVGVDPNGFDAWCQQDTLALDMSIGAPPDAFNPAGQDWGLPPFDPWALRASAYAPLRSLLRSSFTRFGALRIDHVMGLFRLFWIPRGAGPEFGTYVRYRPEELLAVIRLEAARAGAFVVGEDLGTVEDGVRERLASSGIAGTKVAWFDGAPEHWPPSSLGTLTTHDLPTVLGALGGGDPGADPAFAAHLREVLGDGSTGRSDIDQLVEAHRRLANAGSDLVLVTTDDLLGATDRPNQPGGSDDYPSWCIPLPVPLEDLDDHPIAQRIATEMANARPLSE
ncbi:MAG: 4-alpha-glucanotransferase [Microthrixaceae bacterium]|nr:4-alpha-glucanotransferase [Microthrixaceae bacterium]